VRRRLSLREVADVTGGGRRVTYRHAVRAREPQIEMPQGVPSPR
jgi:hypothetical protein